MVWIPGGIFQMGSDTFYPEERPARRVAVDGFLIDASPVTNGDFRAFVSATGYRTLAERSPDPAAYPGVDPALLVPGSLVFRRPPRGTSLRDYRVWWAYVPGACWRHPEGAGSTLEGRLMGKATAFDIILGIMIGSVMSRGINGSAGLGPTLVGGAVLVVLHWVFAVIAFRTSWFGDYVKGRPVLLVEYGRVRPDAMREASLSRNDLDEALRLQGMQPDPARVRCAYLERDGTISVIAREERARILEVSVADGVQTVRIQIG
ncbi:MAG: SUMF1/EgtB/PvdO family nonheme iron enzyme [Gemmatimonadetes bacterium]|nr:SUMF1/EgtB/PvdO family nonheme iron enzyme [Gemmatimonadota bacterium]